jgi:hypothetical protein
MDQMVSPAPFLRRRPLAAVRADRFSGKSIRHRPSKVHVAGEKASKKFGVSPVRRVAV